jgi:hypothetical protein
MLRNTTFAFAVFVSACLARAALAADVLAAQPNTTAPAADDRNAAARDEAVFRLTPEQRDPHWLVSMAGDLGLVFDRQDDGVRLLSFFDLAKHQQLMGPSSPPLFDVTMRHGETKEVVGLEADHGWDQVRVTVPDAADGGAAKRVEFCWQSPKDKRLGDLRIVAAASLDAAAGAVRWTLRVDQVAAPWSVQRAMFPQIAVAAKSPQATFFYPCGAGRLARGPWKTSPLFQGNYPSGWASMQWMAVYDAQLGAGVYCGFHDPFGGTKKILADGQAAEQAVVLHFGVPAENLDVAGNGYVQCGEVVWQLLRGDWFDAAQIYRAWVRQEAKWFPKLGAEGREDTPLWMRELPVWVQAWGPPETAVPAIEGFEKAIRLPFGVHWYKWHQNPFDNDYPHYFPPNDGFADAVRKLQAGQAHIMPYINGRLWDTHDKGAEDFEFTKLALPAVTKQEDGKPFVEEYGSKEADGSPVRLGVMCPSTKLWQDTIRSIVLRLMNECGVKGVYIDQIAAADPVLCVDHGHGHPTGGGHWWTESYWKMLDAIRREKPADRMVTTECNAEPFIRCFDGYLTWHWGYDNQVPAFPAIYGGSIQMFGRTYRGGDTKDLALRMRAGQQFVYGEQIGWFGTEITGDADGLAFVRQAGGARWQLRRYFYAGEMVRPPKLVGEIPTVRADWQWDNPGWVTTDAVLAGAYALPKEHRCTLLFANVSDQPVTAKVIFDAAAAGLSGGEIKATKITAEGPGETFTSPARIEREVTFPAKSAFAWELTP